MVFISFAIPSHLFSYSIFVMRMCQFPFCYALCNELDFFWPSHWQEAPSVDVSCGHFLSSATSGSFLCSPFIFIVLPTTRLLTSCSLPTGFQLAQFLWCVKDVRCSLQGECSLPTGNVVLLMFSEICHLWPLPVHLISCSIYCT